ncbi:unnamed protein product [Triticum turgidum subsp. durum]|uniref:BTB domain-containing protein n=1 Tax=Triticum turgidum subsp. durum TaxID=4567 RepID=A0A9R0XIL4_TRITD|nr:unnamed protein product [Triticum turgidum subsp. durum]
MAEFKVGSLDARTTKFRTVPIAVTPEGFWCCPSQTVLQKTVKNQNQQTRPKVGASPPASKASSVQRAPTISSERRTHSTPTRSRANSDEQRCPSADNAATNPPKVASERPPKQHKVSVGFGQIEMSDLRVVLYGKDGVAVKMSVHKNILAENSTFFADKLSRQSPVSSIEVPDCEDVEIYVETVGLMYCNDVKQKLIKQSVPRVLRILKVAELLGFRACVLSCLNYLEAVPWAGEEEENVVSSVRHLQTEDYGVTPILKRVCSDLTSPPNDTFVRIIELVLKSSDDRGRREMKSLVLKLLKESSSSCAGSSADLCVETLYSYCQNCLESLLTLFQQASDSDFSEQSSELKEPLPTKSRHLVSCVTARLFVAIGKGEMLPSKDTRQLLLDVWLQPLMDDYNWLQHGCRSFDRSVVEEGIGSTILTLPLEDQQTILLSWLGSFLKVGNSCPNLQKAFEVWWRRTFVRPYVEQQGSRSQSGRS